MTHRPAALIIVVAVERKARKAQPTTTHHASHPGTIRTLCGRHEGLSTVLSLEPVIRSIEVDINGHETTLTEPWPKHWPSTDNRTACTACIRSAELLWRKIDREPNVDLVNCSIILRPLAKELTNVLAEARDELAALGYPTNDERGGGGISDDTGHHATRAHELVMLVDELRDRKRAVVQAVEALERLIVSRQPKGSLTELQDKITCGKAQRMMSPEQRAGWTIDELCARYATRPDGLCDRCGKRADRATEVAA